MQTAWNKHGPDSFKFELVELLSIDTLICKENEYLKEHVGKENCMNISENAECPSSAPYEQRRDALRDTWETPGYRESLLMTRKDISKKQWADPEFKKRWEEARANPNKKKYGVRNKRDYKREYALYHSKPDQIKKRALLNKTRLGRT